MKENQNIIKCHLHILKNKKIKKNPNRIKRQTVPIMANYKGIVEKINAERTKDEIFADVEKVMKKHKLI